MRVFRAIAVALLVFAVTSESPCHAADRPISRATGFVVNRLLPHRRYRRAQRIEAKILAANQFKAQELIEQGKTLCDEEKFADAVPVFSEAIKLDPRSAEAYARRGYAHTGIGDFQEAIADCTEAIRLDPRLPQAYGIRGGLYATQQKVEMALRDLDAAIALDPTEAVHYRNRAAVFCFLKDFEQALADYTEAARLAPENIELLMGRAGCSSRLERFGEAANAMSAVIALKPNEPYYYEIRGALWTRQGKYDRALADFQTMMRLDPNDAAAKFDCTTAKPLDKEALAHGEEQVRRMLADRPVMAEHGEAAGMLHRWAARKFAGETSGWLVNWNRDPPMDGAEGDKMSPTADSPGFIRVREKYQRAPLQGKKRTFEELWTTAIFELFNTENTEGFEELKADAQAGRIGREEYITGKLKVECRAAEKTRAFYIRVYLPWAKEHNVETNPQNWYVAIRSKPEDDLFCSIIDKDMPHWHHYGRFYDAITLKLLIKKGEYEAAEKLRAEMLKQAANTKEKVQIYYTSAKALGDQGKLRQAAADLDELIRLDPKHAQALGIRGSIYSLQGNFDGAIADINEAIRLDPQCADPLNEYLLYSYKQRARVFMAKRDIAKAIGDLSAAAKLDPDDVSIFAGRGYAYLLQDDHSKAVADLTEAIRLDPKAPTAYYNRAIAYWHLKDIDKAIADSKAGIKNDENPAQDALWRLADLSSKRAAIYMEKRDWTRAIDDLKEARRTYPVSVQLDGSVAPDDSVFRPKQTKPTRAKPSAKQSKKKKSAKSKTSTDSDDDKKKQSYAADLEERNEITALLIEAYVKRGTEHAEKGELTPAAADLSEALALDPSRLALLIDRGVIYRRNGEYDKAIADFDRAIEVRYSLYEAHLNRGMAHLERNSPDAAIADFTEAILLNRYAPSKAYCHRAEAYLKKGDLDAAMKDAEAAVANDPKSAEAYRSRGRVRRQKGEKEKADQDFTEAERLEDADR